MQLQGMLAPIVAAALLAGCSSSSSPASNPTANRSKNELAARGGTRIVLEADVHSLASPSEVDKTLDKAVGVMDARLKAFGIEGGSAKREQSRIIVELPGASPETARDITRPAVLMFCEGLQRAISIQRGGPGSPLATVPDGSTVAYKPGTCQPDIDASGQILIKNADKTTSRITPQFVTAPPIDNIVWTPARGELNDSSVIMTGDYLKSDAEVQFDALNQPQLSFSMSADGKKVFGSLSQRLIGLPFATFFDGEPLRTQTDRNRDGHDDVIAPTIHSRITDQGVFTGLSETDATRLSRFINSGSIALPLTVVDVSEISGTEKGS